jgi:hypothetical protein
MRSYPDPPSATAQGVRVSSTALHLDLPAMLAVTAISLPIVLYQRAVVRWEGLPLIIGALRRRSPGACSPLVEERPVHLR